MTDKVVKLEDKKSKTESSEEAPKEETFAELMERNRKNKERLERERLAANKSVLRSYRLKN